MRILVAEDERDLNRIISRTLEEESYAVDSVFDGESALEYLEGGSYDLAVLDIMMPRMDGLEAVRRYRADGGKTPVIFLTARDAVKDRVEGLDSGADDYLVKPFSFDELLARVRSLLRRNGAVRTSILTVADLTLDTSSHEVRRCGVDVELSSKEYALLEYLMMNQGVLLSRDTIRDHLWSWDYDGQSNIVDVYIRFLRRKIDDGHEKKLIHTVRGSGYMLKDGL